MAQDGEHELPHMLYIKFPLPPSNAIRAVLKGTKMYKREVVSYRHVLPRTAGVSYVCSMLAIVVRRVNC